MTVAITNCETMGTLAPGRVVPRSAAPKPPRLDLETGVGKVMGSDLETEAVKVMASDQGAGAVKRRADDSIRAVPIHAYCPRAGSP